MKRILIAAGALLVGSSAIALAGDKVDTTAAKDLIVAEKSAKSTKDVKFAKSDNPKLQLAASALDQKVDKPVELAWYDGKDQTGMGGPLEEVETVGGNTTAEALTPRPATRNYPPCRGPGPGDDNCIQLYEPGVRAQLASWNRPTGGLGSGEAETGMGGPLEEVDKPVTTPGEGSVFHDGIPGVGGPVEERSGYPPCSATVTDSCIQLYEPGVTGQGN
jgi:hypothetical protein